MNYPIRPLATLLALPLLASALPQAVAQESTDTASIFGDQVAIIDVERIFNEYYRRGIAQAEIDQISGELNQRLQRARLALVQLVQQAQQRQTEIEAMEEGDAKTTAEEELATLVAQAQQLDGNITQAAQQYQQGVSQRSTEVSAEIYDEIQAHLERLAQREGYQMIINRSAVDQNGLPIFPYVFDQRDLTSDVIAELNASRPPQVVVQPPDLSGAAEIDEELVDSVLGDAEATEESGDEVGAELAVPTGQGGAETEEESDADASSDTEEDSTASGE